MENFVDKQKEIQSKIQQCKIEIDDIDRRAIERTKNEDQWNYIGIAAFLGFLYLGFNSGKIITGIIVGTIILVGILFMNNQFGGGKESENRIHRRFLEQQENLRKKIIDLNEELDMLEKNFREKNQ